MPFLSLVRRTILAIMDWFHRPFSRWIDTQTFRYLASGGSNAAINMTTYFIAYNYILDKQPGHIGVIPVSAHIGAFLIAFSISFPYGFIMSRYVVFTESDLRGRVQLFRYMLLVLVCIGLNYFLIKFFVEVCHFFPSLSNAMTQALVAIFSYISQRHFTFRVKPTDPLTEEVFLDGESEPM